MPRKNGAWFNKRLHRKMPHVRFFLNFDNFSIVANPVTPKPLYQIVNERIKMDVFTLTIELIFGEEPKNKLIAFLWLIEFAKLLSLIDGTAFNKSYDY